MHGIELFVIQRLDRPEAALQDGREIPLRQSAFTWAPGMIVATPPDTRPRVTFMIVGHFGTPRNPAAGKISGVSVA
jgi:hypothetical protein